MHRPRLSKSTSAATATSTSTTTSVIASGVAQEARQRQQGSFAGMSTTVHTPQSSHIPAAEQPFAGLRLLAEVSASQVDPLAALASHRTVNFNDGDEYQEQPEDSLSLANAPSQPAEDTTTNIPENEILPSINEHLQRKLSGTVPETFLT